MSDTLGSLCYNGPLVRENGGEDSLINITDHLLKRLASSLENLVYQSHFQLSTLISFLINKKTLKNAFSKAMFEVFDKILEVTLVSKVETARVESIRVDTVAKRESS